MIIFILLSSEDGWDDFFHAKKEDGRAPALWNGIFSTISFVLGAATSVLSGFLGMKIATYANARTAVEARKGIAPAFMCAFRSGAVMGFLLSGCGLFVIYIAILIYKQVTLTTHITHLHMM